MNRDEYALAITRAKRERLEKKNNPADPVARLQFEQDFAEPLDDARNHMPPRSEDLASAQARAMFWKARRAG